MKNAWFTRVLCTLAAGISWSWGTAHAFSRVVIVTGESATIAMDGIPAPTPIGNRTILQAVAAGDHTFTIFTPMGQTLHQERVTIPDKADVHIQWSRGASFVITGAQTAGPAAGGVDHTNDTPTGVAQPQGSWTNSSGGTTSTGSLGPASGPRASDLLVGGGSSGTGSAGQQGRSAAALTGSRSADAVIGAGVSGFQAMTYGAEAGTNFGGDGPFQQQIKKAQVVYGTVVFIKLGGPPMRVYSDGMLVAELAQGATKLEANIEVGRQPLEFRSAVDHVVLWQGDLMLDRSHVIQLAFDDRNAPKPQVRPWLWQGY